MKKLVTISEDDFKELTHGWVMDLFARYNAAASDPEKVTEILHEIEWFNTMISEASHTTAPQ